MTRKQREDRLKELAEERERLRPRLLAAWEGAIERGLIKETPFVRLLLADIRGEKRE